MPRRKPAEPQIDQIFKLIAAGSLAQGLVYDLRSLLGVEHVIYTTALSTVDPTIRPLVRTTYPALWLKRYVDMSYENVDPILKRGYASAIPFQWSEVEVSSFEAVSMMNDAVSYGVGPDGLSVPVVNKGGRRGLFSVVGPHSQMKWRIFCSRNLETIIQTANCIHKSLAHTLLREPPLQLSGREIECLFWCARGKEASDMALILGLSIHTVREYLKSARYKLDCTNLPQAVAKAIVHGLISAP